MTTGDTVVAPRFQRRSAQLFDARVIDIDAEHSAPLTAPEQVANAIQQATASHPSR